MVPHEARSGDVSTFKEFRAEGDGEEDGSRAIDVGAVLSTFCVFRYST